MKTPTLIVRLVGLYLLGQSAITLLQIQKMHSMAAGMNMQNPVPGDILLYSIIALLLGLVAVIWAGPLARILTFDADSSSSQ